MAVSHQAIFVTTPNNAEDTIVNADGTTAQALISASADGTKVMAVNVTSDDTVDRVAVLWLDDGTTSYRLGSKTIPAGAGYAGVAAVNLLDPAYIPGLDALGHLFIDSPYSIEVSVEVAVTSTKTITVVALGADYTAV